MNLELRVPPVAVVALAAALMWVAARWLPQAAFPLPARGAVAVALVALGAAIAIAGVVEFRRARTTVNPMTPEAASAVVATGVFRFSRNPMYLGMLFALAGWGAWLGNAVSLVALPLFVLYMNRFQIVPEERALAERFGDAYRAYLQRVRRWI